MIDEKEIIKNRIIDILSEYTYVKKESINGECEIIDHLSFDSSDIINSIMDCENAFEIHISDERIMNLNYDCTVDDVVEMVQNIINERNNR